MSSSASRVWMITGRSQLARERDLLGEHRLLHVARREVVVDSRARSRRWRARSGLPATPRARAPTRCPGPRRTHAPDAGARRPQTAHRATARRRRSACACFGRVTGGKDAERHASTPGLPCAREHVVQVGARRHHRRGGSGNRSWVTRTAMRQCAMHDAHMRIPCSPTARWSGR